MARVRAFLEDVGLVLGAYFALLAFENVVIGIAYKSEFASTWEMQNARNYLTPLAFAASIPLAFGVVLLARFPRVLVAPVGALAGLALGVGLTSGRHFDSLVLRVPFVLVIGALGAGAGHVAARKLPGRSALQLAVAGVGVALAAWLADGLVLPRLYPAFHLALFGVMIVALAGLFLPLRGTLGARVIAGAALAFALFCVVTMPRDARRIAPQDNLRRVLLEHAPALGRAVVVAAKIAPPEPLEDDEAATTTLTSLRNRGARALDWHGHDIVVVTIDALRADHLSSYGYARKTTPHIDAIAARGVRFEHAYCPTPHTSYSIASMMTGKYMKSLLALQGDSALDDSETWPVQLQRYGYRTAAFYPPAVFFIDEHRFGKMRDTHLGFEYAKVEFAKPALKRQQIEGYLAKTPKDKPLFLWVHLFEPHEPYEMHPEHPFTGDPKVDAYDSEVAEADELVGDVEELVAKYRPPGTVMIVSADHGEEHGDHGGRYHGTTVYEEQVRVPLIVAMPGLAPRVVTPPVQTIDLLPTTLAALDVPTPPRLRGRDLGPNIAGLAPANDEGLAFAETDDYTLVARGADRLVCQRKIASCTLFDVAKDPHEEHAVSDRPDRVTELKKLTAAIERETGKVEASGLPEALRRGMQGDLDAAEDVAPLLDDARVDIRRLAARVAFRLKAPVMKSQLARSFAHDEDAEVHRWTALALVRLGEDGGAKAVVEAALTGTPEERVAAALALAEQGDARGEGELVARWNAAFVPDTKTPGELDEARALLAVFGTMKTKAAVPGLIKSLEDVRLRPHVVTALAAIGDPRAKEPLAATFANERYVHLRAPEARALLALGAKQELLAPLKRFAGLADPMPEALDIAREAGLLVPANGGTTKADAVSFPVAGPARVLIQATGEPSGGHIGTGTLPAASRVAPDLWVVDVGMLEAGTYPIMTGGQARWLVPKSEEIPPPAPKAWDAGAPEQETDAPLTPDAP